jgi:ubiquinone/menaquinone biosynthesis C-methylase UbiE
MNNRVFTVADAYKLEDPERLKWLPPGEVLAALQAAPGMVVADIGAGTGFFSIPLAGAVAPAGKIYAVDFQAEMLKLIAQKLAGGVARNIELVEGSAADTHLAEASCDLVLAANVWHELDDTPSVLKEMSRILKPGGRFAVLDWRTDVTRPPGPPLDHRLSSEQVREAAEAAGWRCSPSRNIGTYSYIVVCAKVS